MLAFDGQLGQDAANFGSRSRRSKIRVSQQRVKSLQQQLPRVWRGWSGDPCTESAARKKRKLVAAILAGRRSIAAMAE